MLGGLREGSLRGKGGSFGRRVGRLGIRGILLMGSCVISRVLFIRRMGS